MFYDKKLFLKISQNSQENTSVTVFFFLIKLQVSGIGILLEFLRGPFLENTYARLLLIIGRNSGEHNKKNSKKEQ